MMQFLKNYTLNPSVLVIGSSPHWRALKQEKQKGSNSRLGAAKYLPKQHKKTF